MAASPLEPDLAQSPAASRLGREQVQEQVHHNPEQRRSEVAGMEVGWSEENTSTKSERDGIRM